MHVLFFFALYPRLYNIGMERKEWSLSGVGWMQLTYDTHIHTYKHEEGRLGGGGEGVGRAGACEKP